MRYLVRGKVIDGKSAALLEAIESGVLGRGSIAHKTFLKCMKEARLTTEGEVRWLEVCYCREAFGPGYELYEELPYWEAYFEEIDVRFARKPEDCEGYPVCGDCDCTGKARGETEETGRTLLHAPGRNRLSLSILNLSRPNARVPLFW